MPMVRAMRMLNAIEAGTLTGSQLETLLTSDPGRLAEFNVLLGLRGQVRRMAASRTAMQAVAASSQAMAAVAASQNALAAIRQSSTAISAINASSQALDILYNAATKFAYAGGSWSANPATLVTGNFLLVRIRQITNPGGWGDGAASGHYIRIGGSGWTATNGQSTNNLINRTTLPHVYDNALRPVNNTTIQYYLYNSYEIAYLAA